MSVPNQMRAGAEEGPLQAERTAYAKCLVISREKSKPPTMASLRGNSAPRERHKGFLGILDLFSHTDHLASDLELNNMDIWHNFQMWASMGLTRTPQQTQV